MRATRSTSSRSQNTAQRVSIRDITDSLHDIDSERPPEKKRQFLKRKGVNAAKKRHTWRRRLRWLLVLAFLAVVGYFGYRILVPTLKLTHGNLLSLVEPGTPLKTDSQGRTNILIFGTSQDDAAHQDAEGGGGLWLTDSIMVMSLNQSNHTATMVSIPRDLWTHMPENCSVGYRAKINAVYECGSDLYSSDASAQNSSGYAAKDQQGASALESTIQNVTGLSMQYYVHVNYSVVKQVVDALGGIQVNIVGDGADGIYDTNFDWACPNGKYTCKNVYYPHNGTYTLDGTQALYLARARADASNSSYLDFGLDRGDFDRQINQQKIIEAIKSRATSTGTLMNPLAVTSLLDALGDNISTDLQGGNYKTLIDFAKKMPKSNGMKSVSLGGAAGDSPLVTGTMIDGQSVEAPSAGTEDYSAIISYIARQLSTNPAVSEDASVAIYNATDTTGVAKNLGDQLSAGGLDVATVGNVYQSDSSGQYTIYDTTGGKKPQTIKYLESTLKGATILTSMPPSSVAGSADIIIIVGAAR